MEQHLLHGDSKDVLKTIKDGSIDLLATDPPYGIEFMGKSWDKVLPDKEIWSECYRVLKPGAFIAVMSSPRSDVLYRMIKDLEDAGFDMSFSPILWAYHTGFPKASDTSKMLDKRLGAERNVVGIDEERYKRLKNQTEKYISPNGLETTNRDFTITEPSTDLAKKYEGSKLGFQPKPVVEHIIIGMKPHGSKSYIDNVLNFEALPDNIKMTYPFLQVPKPAKSEKDFGLTGEDKPSIRHIRQNEGRKDAGSLVSSIPRKNNHPTTKPVKLMSYIITLFTREGDFVLDPFLGSGTTGIASKLMGRSFIGIEREQEYMDIAQERCEVSREELIKFFKMDKDNQTKLDL
jgi:site-specific DNA-methyltransferase (adenine-specific)